MAESDLALYQRESVSPQGAAAITQAGSSDPARRPIKKLSKRPLILEPIDNFTTSKTY